MRVTRTVFACDVMTRSAVRFRVEAMMLLFVSLWTNTFSLFAWRPTKKRFMFRRSSILRWPDNTIYDKLLETMALYHISHKAIRPRRLFLSLSNRFLVIIITPNKPLITPGCT
ncbi:hypothetical protein F4859DRAFT_8039 [Xylaria cf. heliscus]|nr:hypothetical protein F4859DRAFT_8039 [Xylaria cf. heliscus]